jgi:hypothetical protein
LNRKSERKERGEKIKMKNVLLGERNESEKGKANLCEVGR